MKSHRPVLPGKETVINLKTTPAAARNRKRYRRSTAGKITIILLLVLFAFLAGLLLKSIVTRFMISIIPAETAVLEDTIELEFLVIRQENATSAPFAGRFEEAISDGERVAKNATIGYLIRTTGTSLEGTEKIAVVAEQAGVLSYQLDGYESILTPSVWPQLNTAKLSDLQGQTERITTKQIIGSKTLQAGELFYKIVDNLAPFNLYAKTLAKLPDTFEKGLRVDLRLEELAGLVVDGRIVDHHLTDTDSSLLLSIPYISGLENIRFAKGEIVTAKHSGVVVDPKVLVRKDEKDGVYLLSKGHVLWSPVVVAATVKGKAVLIGLKPEDWIIATPNLVKEGQRVFSRH